MKRPYRPGDKVVYSKTKHGPHPGPRAKHVLPARHGDDYTYHVDKYWIVVAVEGENVVVQTRRGKRHEIPIADPSLRHAHWWEKWRYRQRFPQVQTPATNNENQGPIGKKSQNFF